MQDAVPKNHGSNVTILGALSCEGLDAVMTIDGPTDAAVFRAYVSEVLARTREALDEALAYAIDLIMLVVGLLINVPRQGVRMQ